MPILDFRELSAGKGGSPPGEDFEGLVRELGRLLALNPEWSGRGADQGRDLIFIERLRGVLGTEETRWLVSCKDFAKSGRAVAENDVGPVSDKLVQHNAQGFLLATTTTVTTGLKALLDGLSNSGKARTKVWDRHELEAFLVQEAYLELTKRFLPQSYAAVRTLGGLSQVLDALQVLVPRQVYDRFVQVVEAYQVGETWLTGEKIWPHDRESIKLIDASLMALLEKDNALEAAQVLLEGEVELDAFEATLKTLSAFKPLAAKDLCRRLLIADENAVGAALFTYRFYMDTFEPSGDEQIALACELGEADLLELYADEIYWLIGQEFPNDPARYSAWSDLDTLASQTIIEDVYSYSLSLVAKADKTAIEFRAEIQIGVSLLYDGEASNNAPSFPGEATGHIDAQGIFLNEVTVDTSSFYDGDEEPDPEEWLRACPTLAASCAYRHLQ